MCQDVFDVSEHWFQYEIPGRFADWRGEWIRHPYHESAHSDEPFQPPDHRDPQHFPHDDVSSDHLALL
jgi:hypothetical protein